MKQDRTIIAFLITVLILAGAYMYWKKTAPERQYKNEIKQLKLISEHQDLEIEVALQRKDLAELKKEAEKNVPQYNLTPPPEKKEVKK